MRICIDSCVFIEGLIQTDSAAARLLDQVGPGLVLVIPRLVAQEVTRNLQSPEQVRRFYRLFRQRPFAFIIDELRSFSLCGREMSSEVGGQSSGSAGFWPIRGPKDGANLNLA